MIASMKAHVAAVSAIAVRALSLSLTPYGLSKPAMCLWSHGETNQELSNGGGGKQVRKNDTECVSCSIDGSCMIWDLTVSNKTPQLYSITVNQPFF
jgi:hypothetical protein